MLDEAGVRLEVSAELDDTKYKGMKHHTASTYNKGCRGPLCRKAARDYGRERYRALNGVPEQEIHKPTVRTRWDALLETLVPQESTA